MLLAVYNIFAASKSEPLAAALERVHAAFAAAGFGEPSVRFTLTDHAEIAALAPLAGIKGMTRVSSIARVLKRFPEFEAFARETMSTRMGGAATRHLSNIGESGTIQPVAFATLLEIASGVPKSFPFQKALFHFAAPGFSGGPALPAVQTAQTMSMLLRSGVDLGAGHPTTAGVSVQDAWWVNGRQRNMAALRIVEADPAAKKLPPPPDPVAAVLAACGKVRKTLQLPMAVAVPAVPSGDEPRVRAVVKAWRARLPELLGDLPHDLSPEVPFDPLAPGSGPKKPALEAAFAPMGYDCRGNAIGTFLLRRRTAGNLTVELQIDTGTWNNALLAFLRVVGLIDGKGFKATLGLPAAPRAVHGMVHGADLYGQFLIGGPERWRQIVDNLAALVAVLDRGFVPEVAAAAGPSPEWFQHRDG